MFRYFLHLKSFEFVKQEDAVMKEFKNKGITPMFGNSTFKK